VTNAQPSRRAAPRTIDVFSAEMPAAQPKQEPRDPTTR
jgi:hypothetical protein